MMGSKVQRALSVAVLALGVGAGVPASAAMELTAFKQAVAVEASGNAAISAFYRERDYAPFWTTAEAAPMRSALLHAIAGAQAHGLPVARYDADALTALFHDVRTQRDVARAEVGAMRMFLAYARDVSSGVLSPADITDEIKRKVDRPDPAQLIQAFAQAESPEAFLRALPPDSPEYARLLRTKMRLERLIAEGGWGDKVPGYGQRPGDSGPQVVALRNRLIAMGYLSRSATRQYDAALQSAVQQFQLDHGLEPDGVAGRSTIDEVNVSPETRLRQVLVAMERERWLGDARGGMHVLVNITDFHARLIEEGEVVFETRSVVGQNRSTHRTPEFSDVMEHMIINPSWNVPRSIAVSEYLPQMMANPGAAGHLQLIDGSGRVVSRASIDFSRYNARNFPFDLKQPPSRGNALGQVKFMFPNPYNIYLHDTPSQHLFVREVRAFSHGCIRLDDPFDFAYALLALQTEDPKGFFHDRLATGRETKVDLETPLPVHIIYRTAMSDPRGRMQYRRDIYGRDAAIFDALRAAGVALAPVRG
ncbi:L,D-transpeptidase family protein [Rhodovulum adriaticum]|uniref:Murein L,D-transpeptidase YcbB/YkuD n=1 Tax=Rhodovulum adriaticum TaxID=35804 RepID=A0A4R2NVT9_RHOAD|nr:L,D-transpeptidase family protein [Rhodovulum adriaticum]MBK1635624.1 murein L,D-transpeptidase [Rhodovulum adriaticum]TCP26140.1 murein L,D-transpeptidase YcbB/YkuD [Rhodovulum adriaticum]